MSVGPHRGGQSGRLNSDWSMGGVSHSPPGVSREIHCYRLDWRGEGLWEERNLVNNFPLRSPLSTAYLLPHILAFLHCRLGCPLVQRQALPF